VWSVLAAAAITQPKVGDVSIPGDDEKVGRVM
jgi:hypothetical protein